MVALSSGRWDQRKSTARRVEDTLRSFGPFRFSDVSVQLLNGRLNLIGAVPSPFARQLAVDLARSTASHHEVVDGLTIVEHDPSELIEAA